jgi:two-component system, OmpR family, sensor histidine kinase BaeS
MRLWQRLFLVIAGVGAVAVVAVLLAQQQAFRRGFVDYLNTLEARQAEAIRDRLVVYYRDDPDWWSMRQDPRRWGEVSGLQLPPRRPRPEDLLQDGGPPRFDPPPLRDEARRVGPQPRPPRGPAIDFAGRLQLFDAEGTLVVGPPRIPPDAKLARWPIEVDGATVGELRLATMRAPVAELDREFALSQTRRGLWTAALLLPLALLAAYSFARLALRPLAQFARGFHALASGRFETRVDATRRDEFGELAGDFNHLADALARQRDSQRAYIADVAHELRTPIAILRGELHALEDGVRKLDHAAVESLSGEVARLTRLVEDLHLLAQSDVGALSYRMQRVDLNGLLHDLAATWSAQFERAGLAFHADLRDGPAWVDGDDDRLQQLFGNLLANSLCYTDAPGRVTLSLQRDGRDWHVVVADSAPGVPSDALPRLFDRLYRVDASRARSHGGAGLGLAIAERVVAAHRGRIGASASALGGLAVSVGLPAEDAA